MRLITIPLPITILQFLVPLPEDLAVLDDLGGGLALHLLADVGHVVTAILLIQPKKRINISFLSLVYYFFYMIQSLPTCDLSMRRKGSGEGEIWQ